MNNDDDDKNTIKTYNHDDLFFYKLNHAVHLYQDERSRRASHTKQRSCLMKDRLDNEKARSAFRRRSACFEWVTNGNLRCERECWVCLFMLCRKTSNWALWLFRGWCWTALLNTYSTPVRVLIISYLCIYIYIFIKFFFFSLFSKGYKKKTKRPFGLRLSHNAFKTSEKQSAAEHKSGNEKKNQCL